MVEIILERENQGGVEIETKRFEVRSHRTGDNIGASI